MGKRHLILVGPSGTGKSSVAVQLAARLGWPWLDTDEQVEQQAGRSVARIFRELGEPAFRLMESGAVARACQTETPTVIAVGGGA
ncbi:MAG: shikimate kinase, partial [Candidatus Chloroheliales bacterium]